MSAREEILGRVRASLRSARLPPPQPLPPRSCALESLPPERWRERFVAELRALGVAVHQEASEAAAAARVVERIGGERLIAWDERALPDAVAEALRRSLSPGQRVPAGAPRTEQAAAGVGLTGADAAIAETGTLVLACERDRPRLPSMLPRRHLAVVRATAIVPSLRAALARLRDRIPAAAALHFVTGPSRTADIELALTLGVHGPRELEVVLAP